MGPVKPLKEKFNGRCTTVSEVDFVAPVTGVSVAAGGFGTPLNSRSRRNSINAEESMVSGNGLGVSDSEWVSCACCASKGVGKLFECE